MVGAGDSAESLVLAEIYAGALARTGLPVRVHPDLGQRSDYLGALDTGAVEDYAFRAENIVPLLRTGLLDEVRMHKLIYVAGELTTAELPR